MRETEEPASCRAVGGPLELESKLLKKGHIRVSIGVMKGILGVKT